MINQISNDSVSNSAVASASQKVEVNDDFIKMLTDKFSNDDVRDAYQDCKGSIMSLCNASALFGVDTDDNIIGIGSIKDATKRDFKAFQYMLDDALEQAGISKNPSFNVQCGGDGELYIDSDHPQKESIEKILNETPNIANTYKRISANSSLIASSQRHAEFSKAYEIDPESAVQKYRYLFDNNPCDIFSIFVSEEGYEANLNSYNEDVDWNELVGSKQDDLMNL